MLKQSRWSIWGERGVCWSYRAEQDLYEVTSAGAQDWLKVKFDGWKLQERAEESALYHKKAGVSTYVTAVRAYDTME